MGNYRSKEVLAISSGNPEQVRVFLFIFIFNAPYT